MNKIANAFNTKVNTKALIPFVTCGDPTLERTEAVVRAMAKAGADIVGLGIPFSDPTAEGPVIQAATKRALAAGTTTDKIFAMVERLRADVTIPFVFMTYANVVFSYGSERFIARCHELGIDGIILPDVPYEEKEEFETYCDKYDVALIRLVAPTSGARIPMLVEGAKGFLYVVSSLGVTGVRDHLPADLPDTLAAIRKAGSIPTAVGFGISTPEQARAVAKVADGVIVGSAVVQKIHESEERAPEVVADYIRTLKAAMMEA